MAGIILATREVEAQTVKYGTTEATLTEGMSLTVESSPMGEEFFNQAAPAGKHWVVRINLEILETDV